MRLFQDLPIVVLYSYSHAQDVEGVLRFDVVAKDSEKD